MLLVRKQGRYFIFQKESIDETAALKTSRLVRCSRHDRKESHHDLDHLPDSDRPAACGPTMTRRASAPTARVCRPESGTKRVSVTPTPRAVRGARAGTKVTMMNTSSAERLQLVLSSCEEGGVPDFESRPGVCPEQSLLFDSFPIASHLVQESGIDFGLVITE